MSQVTTGPPTTEKVAADYAVGLSRRLKCERGWRKDIFALLRQEYDSFVQLAVEGDFVVHSMWQYGWLVDATTQYLRYKQSEKFSIWFHRKVVADLTGINKRIRLLDFDERELDSMRQAYDRMAPLIKAWETKKEARE